MESGLVTSLSGALAQSRRIETLANNVANADTPGFKSRDLVFEEMLEDASATDDRTDVAPGPLRKSEILARKARENRPVLHGNDYANLKPGALRQTGNPFDIAIQGNGFLEVLSPEGIRLTRAGNLSLNDKGQIVNRDGFLVLGQGKAGAAEQDPSKRALTLGNGRLQISQEGDVYKLVGTARENVGKLSLVQVENPSALKPIGNTLWEAGEDAFLKHVGQEGRGPASVIPEEVLSKVNPLGPTTIRPQIHQRMLESSNVKPVGQMTKLIQAHRLYEQNLKIMQSVGEMTGRLSEVGKF